MRRFVRCEEQPCGTLAPGESLSQRTFVTQAWRVRDASTGMPPRELVQRSPSPQVVERCACEGP